MSTPFEQLGLPPNATAVEIKAKWRHLAQIFHPDKGGDPEIFVAVQKAYQAALKLAEAPQHCHTCSGTGQVSVMHGFSPIVMTCQVCYGTGVQA